VKESYEELYKTANVAKNNICSKINAKYEFDVDKFIHETFVTKIDLNLASVIENGKSSNIRDGVAILKIIQSQSSFKQ